MLNTRQRMIVSDLSKSNKFITANTLANKYSCSLRTIRNDIKEITVFLEKTDAKFIKLPGSGMRIIAKNNIYEKDKEYFCKDFISYESDIKNIMLLLSFTFHSNPLVLNDLADIYDVSKGTVINSINLFNETLSKKNVILQGKKNKGYYIKTTNSSFARIHQDTLSKAGGDILKNTVFDSENGYLNETYISLIYETVEYISTKQLLLVNDNSSLCYLLAVIIFGKKNNLWKKGTSKEIHNEPKLLKIQKYIENLFNVDISGYPVTLLYHALCSYTDFNEDVEKPNENDKFSLAVRALIDSIIDIYPELKEEKDNLFFDLIRHIKTQINRQNLKLNEENPLLNQIRARYPEVFQEIKNKGISEFNRYYKVKFNDDEIGYLTLYFCRSLEKIRQIREAKVLVVCNTGRGASKLLVTRIMNNCPEIHVVAMASSFNLEKDSEILKNIDLIISTIALPEIDKPYVIVSPILQDFELVKIREAVYLGKQNYTKIVDNELNYTVDSLVKQYVNYDNVEEVSQKLNKIIDDNKIYTYESYMYSGEIYAQICIETFALIQKVYPNGLAKENVVTMSGLMAHIFMSLDRWRCGNFIEATDVKKLKKEHKRKYEEIEIYLKKVGEILNIYIDPIEIIAILRYMLF